MPRTPHAFTVAAAAETYRWHVSVTSSRQVCLSGALALSPSIGVLWGEGDCWRCDFLHAMSEISPFGTGSSSHQTSFIIQQPRLKQNRNNCFPIFSILALFWKNYSRLMWSSRCLCVWYTLYQLLNGWTSLYETRYVYHDTSVSIIGAINESIPSVCMLCVHAYPPDVYRQR
jgi:hypothetical protein